jgi:hypothetical protein
MSITDRRETGEAAIGAQPASAAHAAARSSRAAADHRAIAGR